MVDEIDWESRHTRLKIKHDRMKKALEVTKEIQLAMLPKEQPNFPGYDIYGRIKQNHEVGGDHYDFISLGEDKLEVIIADAAGKGLEASSITHTIHSAIDMASRLGERDLQKTIGILNNLLFDHTPKDRYATLIAGYLTKNRFRYVIAGHETPLMYSKGEIKGVKKNLAQKGTNNMALGAFPGIEYDTFSVNFKSGDMLFLYSDGIADSIERAGTVKLGKVIKKHRQATSEQISDEIYNFISKYPQRDDQTIVIIKKL